MEIKQITSQDKTKSYEPDQNSYQNRTGLLIQLLPIKIDNYIFIYFIKVLFQICNIYLALLYYQLALANQIDNQFYNSSIIFLQRVIMHDQQTIVLSTVALISLTIAQNIVLYSLFQVKWSKILTFINQKIFKILIILIEFNLLLTTLLFLSTKYQIIKLLFLIIATGLGLFSDFFMQSISSPKQFLHSNHPKFIILLRLSTTAFLSISIIGFLNKTGLPLVITSPVIIIVIYASYKKDGYRTYLHQSPRILLQMIVSMLLATCSTIILEFFSHSSSMSILIIFTLTMLSLNNFFINQSQNLINQSTLTVQSIKKLYHNFILNKSRQQLENKVFIIGLEKMHQMENCYNPKCFLNKQIIYCSQQQIKIQTSKINFVERFQAISKNLIKCFLQKLIYEQPQNYEAVITYCEFCYFQMDNMLVSSIFLYKIQRKRLTLNQQIRLHNLKKDIEIDIQKGKFINYNHLDMQHVIYIDETSENLNQKMYQVICMNQDIWQRISHKSIIPQDAFNYLKIIQKQKAEMCQIFTSKSYYINSSFKLKKIYAINHLYLNNNFKKQKQIILLDKIIKDNQLTENQQLKRQQLLASTLFQNESMIFHANYQNSTLIINKCNKNVEEILKFTQRQLKNNDIAMIMPKYFRQFHNGAFCKWIDMGCLKLDKHQQGVEIYAIDKQQTLIYVKKIFKIFINKDGKIQFVCLLKKMKDKENVSIVDKSLQVLEASQGFWDQCDLGDQLNLYQKNYSLSQFDLHLYNQILQKINQKITNFQCITYDRHEKITVQKIKFTQGEKYMIKFPCKLQNQSQNIKTTFQTQKTMKQSPVQLLSKLKTLNEQYSGSKNIFMKQPIYTPQQQMQDFKVIKSSLCILSLLIIGIFVGTMILYDSTYTRLENYIQQQALIIKISKNPYLLGIQYYKSIMQIDNQNEVQYLVNHYSEQFLNAISNPNFLSTIFDDNLFPQAYASIPGSQTASLISYELKDIVFMISSTIASFKDLNITVDSSDFIGFNKLLVPMFEIIQMAQVQLYEQYSALFSNIYKPKLVILIVQCVFFVTAIAITLICFYKLCKKLRAILQILMQPSKEDIRVIKEYWKQLKEMHLSIIDQKIQATKKRRVLKPNRLSVNNTSLNSKTQKKIFIIFIVSLLGISASIISLEITNIQKINLLQLFEQRGQQSFGAYPSGIVLGYGLMQKYYNLTVLNRTSNSLKHLSIPLQNLQQLQDMQYLALDNSHSPFQNTLKSYYFDNPCINNPSIFQKLNITSQQCLHFGDGHLANGIISFVSYLQNTLPNLLQRNATYTQEKLIDSTQSMMAMNGYIEDLFNIWTNQFISKVDDVKTSSISLSMVALLIFIPIYYFLISVQFLSRIRKYYKEYVKAYETLMPRNTIEKDKIVLSELVSYSFIIK